MDLEIAEEQAGFRAGKGTREQIVNLHIITEKAREFNQPLFLCFIDYTKAFDTVSHDQLWMTMIDMASISSVTVSSHKNIEAELLWTYNEESKLLREGHHTGLHSREQR